MSELKTRFWVDALRWRVEGAGASAYIAHKGDLDAGVVLVKLVLPARMARLFVPVRDMEGARMWSQPLGGEPVPEQDVDAYVRRRLERDYDLWVVEIDDPHGRDFLNEPIEKS